MAVTLCPQFSFTAGQLDANISQRGDLQQYYKGLKKAENVMVKLTGGVKRRYGTKLLRAAPTTNADKEFRIVDYNGFNADGTTFTHVIVFGQNTADVYDVSEMIPWIRTFICRIIDMNFTSKTLENQFKSDLDTMYRMYGIWEVSE